MNDLEIQERAGELKAKYHIMKWSIGSKRKYSTIEWMEEMDKFLDPLEEPHKTKVREKFLTSIRFTNEKFLKDFPG